MDQLPHHDLATLDDLRTVNALLERVEAKTLELRARLLDPAQGDKAAAQDLRTALDGAAASVAEARALVHRLLRRLRLPEWTLEPFPAMRWPRLARPRPVVRLRAIDDFLGSLRATRSGLAAVGIASTRLARRDRHPPSSSLLQV